MAVDAQPAGAPRRGGAPYTRLLLGAGALLCVVALAGVVRPAVDPSLVAPGVAAADADLSGKSEAEARAAIEALAESLAGRELTLRAGGRELHVVAAEAGFSIDVDATLAAVMGAGRATGLRAHLEALGRARHEVPLAVLVDASAVDELARTQEVALVSDQPFDGAIEIEGGKPVAVAPRAGHRIDRGAFASRLAESLARGGRAPVDVPLVEVTPVLTPAHVEEARARAEAILAGPITLRFEPTEEEIARAAKDAEEAKRQRDEERERAEWRLPKKKSRMKRKGKKLVEDRPRAEQAAPALGPIEVTFTTEELLSAFRTRLVREPSPRLEVALDDGEVQKKLAPVVGRLFDAARDARFEIDAHDQITVVPSRPGTRVDAARLVEALWRAAATPGRTGELPVDRDAPPKFTTEAATALGIKGLVAQYTTHHPCCQPRVKNIHHIAQMLDGVIVKPGETFSVNQAAGPRTLARGFVMAPSIGDGEMVDTPGGGVSQFATTMFNALFDGGYVIKERQPHSFYFHRYPMGIEATLSWPSPDLVFYNDTPAAVLVRCEWGETFIRVKLFGDNGGRRVDRKVSRPFSYTEPKIEYVPDDRRDPEKEKVKEPGQRGFSVDVARVVTLPDGQKREEKRRIVYKARPRVIELHPCKIPEGEKGHTGEKCPEDEGEGGGEPTRPASRERAPDPSTAP